MFSKCAGQNASLKCDKLKGWLLNKLPSQGNPISVFIKCGYSFNAWNILNASSYTWFSSALNIVLIFAWS